MQIGQCVLSQRRNRQKGIIQLFAMLLILTLLVIGGMPAFAQSQQTYWLGRLDETGTEYLFDTLLPSDFAAMLTADGSEYAAQKSLPKPSTQTIDGKTYSFVTTEVSWDKDAIDKGSISYVIDGTLGAKWFTMDAKSAEWPVVAKAVKAQATPMSPGSAWKRANLLVLISSGDETPTIRLSLFGNQQRYWLGRMDGTEYVFDTPLPATFAEAIMAADPKKYDVDKAPRQFPNQTVDGTEYSFVEAKITYDKPQFDKGQVALKRKSGTNDMLWIDGNLNSAVGKPLAKQLPVPKTGEWQSVDMVILVSPNATEPTLQVPIPDTMLAKARMVELGQQTKAGQYYPKVQAPANLDAFREQMLAYGNAGRHDPDFRKENDATCALDLSQDTVKTDQDGKKPYNCTQTEKVYRQSETPPYFADHVLNDKLNQAAQLQAEYLASVDKVSHEGPTAFRDPKSGKSVNLLNMEDRLKFFDAPGNAVEAASGGALGNSPNSWMVSDSHFRPWFNVDGCYPEVGYGAATANGKWYFIAVAVRDVECKNPGEAAKPKPTAAPTSTSTKAQSETKPGTVSDSDGNVYQTVQVDQQLWMAENLRTTTCSDNSDPSKQVSIPFISDKAQWVTQEGAAYTWSSDVGDDSKAQQEYGALYNAYAVKQSSCNICPSGWRVPSQADFQALLDSQGADAHLKLSDPAFWGTGNKATNTSGWNARPAGGQGGDGPDSYDFGKFAYFWSSTPVNESRESLLFIHESDAGAGGIAGLRYGFSVRCVQDASVESPATTESPTATTKENTDQLKLEVGKQYVIRTQDNSFSYFRLYMRGGNRYMYTLCPADDMSVLTDINDVKDIMTVEAAQAQGITPTNQQCNLTKAPFGE
ncbi:MAG: hypothetical protein KDD92_16435 [Caldilineaceae bacterium]|nr:hypothetical protein [Caldilineaceae bacterium]